MACRLVLGICGIAYVLALVGDGRGDIPPVRQRADPLAGLFLVPLGLAWTLLAGALPDGSIRVMAAVLSPALNIGLLAAGCRLVQKS